MAQQAISRTQPAVPAAMDVAGLHLVLNAEAQRLVQQKAESLLRHQPSFQARVDLADAAFPIIDRVLKEEGVPLDFRYLPLQESALQPDAQSVHGAVGYWQLKRETALSLGIQVNNDVDERRHLAASTRAAARYLARNNASLNNWLNALLSYNTGLGGVRPYTLPADAGATQMLITEATSPYLLMFLAHKVAFEPACGLNPKPALRLQEFPAVAGRTLAAQAQTLYADPAALAAQNRWLLASTVPADRTYTRIVPITDAAQAAGVLANQRVRSGGDLLAKPAVDAQNTAEVRLNTLRALIALPGETTADLAQRGGQRLGEFLRHNEMTGFDAAIAGLPYFLQSKRDVGAVEYHVVEPNESIYEVAQKYGMRKKAVLTKNRLAANDEVRPGRVLWLQHVRPRQVAAEHRAVPAADATASQASTPVAPAPAPRPNRDSEEGWGEALPTARPVPTRPVATASEPAAQLPPPAPAPDSTPLADEPAPSPEPVASRPAAEARPAPAVAAPAARPVPAATPTPVITAVAKPTVLPIPASATHRVEPRESVYSIGRLYNIPPAALIAWNNLAPPAGLVIGQLLVLQGPPLKPAAPVASAAVSAAPAPAAPAAKPAVASVSQAGGSHRPVLYVPKKPAAPVAAAPVAAAPAAPAAMVLSPNAKHIVQKGETLYSIARLYKVTVADLKTWNTKADDTARVGEVLKLQADTK